MSSCTCCVVVVCFSLQATRIHLLRDVFFAMAQLFGIVFVVKGEVADSRQHVCSVAVG